MYVAPRLEDAIDQAATLAEEGGVFGEAIGSGGVLVTGSVVTVGEARHMLKPAGATRVNRSIRRAMCAGMLVLQAVVLFLTGVVTIGMTDIGAAASLGLGLGLAVLCVLAAGMLGRPGGYALGWAGAGGLDRARLRGHRDVLPRRRVRGALGDGVLPRASRSTGSGRSVRCWRQQWQAEHGSPPASTE